MSEDINFWERKMPDEIVLHMRRDGVIYQYVSFETAIKILESNCLQYSSPNSFNDPFDLSLDFLDCSLNESDIVDLLNGWEISSEIKEKAVAHYIKNPNELSHYLFKTIEDSKEETGITCFSKSYLKTLMWSHYANKHAGVCLGFSFRDEEEKFIQSSVTYASEIKSINYVQDTRLGMYSWLFTKSHVWNYEEEVRRVSNIGKGLIPFQKEELCEVYYGLRLTEQQIEKIKNLLKSNLYVIDKHSRMIMNRNTFDLQEVKENSH
jgi:hypothetical protein